MSTSSTVGSLLDLDGRVAVVTGAGRGIGWEIAQLLAEARARVAIAEFAEASGREAASRLREHGTQAEAYALDVKDAQAVRATVAKVLEDFGTIDILVNNAGIVFNTPAVEVSDEEWREVMDVNLNGVFWMCREVGRHMRERESGTIVNIASMSGLVANKPQPQAHYNVSKAGVIMLTKSLAAEWAQDNVRVNSVSPGYIGTDLTKRGMSNPKWADTWLEMTPMGRIGEPRDVAQAVLYLASDASSFATGTNLVVDGGYTSW